MRHPHTGRALLSLAALAILAFLLARPEAPQRVADRPATAPDAVALTGANRPNESDGAHGTHGGNPLEAFDAWAARFVAADAEARRSLALEGIQLARARRKELADLIRTNPQQALARAVPMATRQQLPEGVRDQLEERVNAQGFFGVLATVGGDAPAIHREAKFEDGRRFEAFVFGRRERQTTTEKAYLAGIAIDKDLALDERPLRILEAGERIAAGRPVVETCPISGKSTTVERSAEGELPPITDETPAVELGGTIHYLCSGGHIVAVEEDAIAQEGSTGGSAKVTGGTPATYNTGGKTHLIMRVTFADQLTDPQDEKSCYDMMKSVNDFMLENSYGKCYFLPTVTPLLVLPRTEAWYANESASGATEVLTDARIVSRLAGYDPAAYDFDTVTFRGAPGSFGGQAYVGGKGCWLKSSGAGVAAHEYGHNLGLWHANYWNTSPASAIGPGTNSEYGNSFDTMGAANAGAYHFGAYNKSVINWLTPELQHAVIASGTYRIFTIDQAIADPANRYAIKVRKDSDRNYWAEFRQKFPSNQWMTNGIQLTWDSWGSGGDSSATGSNSGPQLLDITPGTPDGKNDAHLVIGRTFSDNEAGVHFTPIGKGATTPESIDVVVNLGTFPGNRPPTLSISASSTAVAANGPVTLSATATDPDGDALAFAWDYGDKSFSTASSAVVTKSWSAAGIYNVRCTVSDMKGKVCTRYVIVTVGSPGTFTISGSVASGGAPVEGVLVSNGLTGTAWRGAYTDSDGAYTIPNLAAGSITVSAQLFGYTFAAGFTNPVAVGPSATGRNFNATLIPTLTLTAPDPVATEGGDTGTFRITRTGSTAAAQIVRFHATSGTATLTSDYTLAPNPASVAGVFEVTIPAGSATLDIVLTPVNDTAQEGPEVATVQLAPIAGFNIAGTQYASITIDDNDTTLPRVSLTVPDPTAHENRAAGGAQFVVARTGATASPLTVQLTIAGTATNGSDYTAIPTSIVIQGGQSTAAVNIAPIDDALVEGNETVTLTIASNAAYVRDATTQTATINDSDVNIITVVATDAAASESGDTGMFTLTRTGDLSAALTIDYALGGTALNGGDYHKLVGAATFAAGEAVATVTIVPIDDAIGEAQQTVILQLRSGITTQLGAPASATVNIADNDLPTVYVTDSDGSALEPATGTSSNNAVFRIYRAGGSSAFTVNYTVSGAATPGSDYTALTGSVAFAAGDTTKDITVIPLADNEVESSETVILTLSPGISYNVAPQNSATVYIQDEDTVGVGVSTEDVSSVSETSTQVRFFISRTGATTAALSVNYTMSGTATPVDDYTGAAGVFTIPAGVAGAYLVLTPVNDTLAEGAETMTLTIEPNPGVYAVRAASATYALLDNDTAGLPQVRFSATTSSGSEASPSPVIPVTLSAASANTVTVAYTINGGTATAGGVDYALASGVLQFDPSVTSRNILLDVIDDIFPESSETVVIVLSNPAGATLGTSTHTYTINDNDSAPAAVVGFSATASSALESDAAPQTIVVGLSAAPAGAVTVDYTVTGGTATAATDYTLASGTLTFSAAALTREIPISVVNDTLSEPNETAVITLSNAAGANLGANIVHTFTITDDDAATVNIAATDNSAAEAGDPGTFTLTRAGSTAGTLAVSVSIGGSATNGADYTRISTPVNFTAGSATANVNIAPILDAFPDADETVVLTLLPGAAYTIGANSSASITIGESGTLVSIAATDASASEAGLDPGAFTITRTGETTDALTVNVSLGGTASIDSDYTAPTLPVTIAAGSATASFSIVPLDDPAPEQNETVIATILADPAYAIGSPGSAIVTILDDDQNFAPSIALTSPSTTTVGIPANVGLILEATVADDGKPLNPGVVTTAWTKVSGPGTVTFGTSNAPDTTARFSLSGTYVVRLTANDSEHQATLDVTVIVGGNPALSGVDIGSPSPVGSHSLNAGTYTIAGGGANISGATDQFRFLSQVLTGDGEMSARIVSMTGGGSSAKAGVMLRANAANNSRAAYMSMYGSANATDDSSWRVRATDGASYATAASSGAALPCWVRIVRTGDNVSGYQSSDGQNWAQVGNTETVALGASVLAGLAVTSGTNGATCTAVIDNVRLSTWAAQNAPFVAASAPANIALPGTAALDGTATDDGRPLPASLTTTWSKASGPGTVTFGDADALDTTAGFSTGGPYVLRLTATDGAVKTFAETAIDASQAAVTVQASDADAGELGANPASFTISRTGATTAPLTVFFTLGGTAINGADYAAIGESVTIEAGQSSAIVAIVPFADSVAEGAEDVSLTIDDSASYATGAVNSSSINIADRPADAWRFARFGSSANDPLLAGDLADADFDGSLNLVEYMAGTNPLTAEAAAPVPGMEPGFLTLTYRRALAATDIAAAVEESLDLASWSPATATEEIVSDNGTIRVIKARVPIGSGGRKLIRLSITRL